MKNYQTTSIVSRAYMSLREFEINLLAAYDVLRDNNTLNAKEHNAKQIISRNLTSIVKQLEKLED
jgi:hypothetical protein